MPNYRYTLRQPSGQVTAGIIAADSTSAASAILRDKGGYIVSLAMTADKQISMLKQILTYSPQLGPSQKDVLNFTSQLAVMIKAGISIRAALDGIAEQTENKTVAISSTTNLFISTSKNH